MKLSDILDESGPSRIIKHIHDGMPFIMVSAYRADKDHATNLRRHDRMKHIIHGLLLSYIKTEGEYHEVGADAPSAEQSFFIMPMREHDRIPNDRLLAIGEKLMHAFDQDTIVYGDGETVWLIANDGSKDKLGNRLTFRPEIIDTLDGFSKVKGRKFSYTNADVPSARVYGQQQQIA